jgi:hypothetical protein
MLQWLYMNVLSVCSECCKCVILIKECCKCLFWMSHQFFLNHVVFSSVSDDFFFIYVQTSCGTFSTRDVACSMGPAIFRWEFFLTFNPTASLRIRRLRSRVRTDVRELSRPGFFFHDEQDHARDGQLGMEEIFCPCHGTFFFEITPINYR